MRRIWISATLALVLTSSLLMPALPAVATTTCDTGGAGTGTLGNPFQIATAAQLAVLATDTDCLASGLFFQQTEDINLSSFASWTPIGSAVFPIDGPPVFTPFRGSYDGQENEIIGLKINSSATVKGLFGLTDGATIKNLRIAGTSDAPITTFYAGLLIGMALNSTILSVQAWTVLSSTGGQVGGLIGSSIDSTITNSEVLSESALTGDSFVGGLVGEMSGGSISNSESSATVEGSEGSVGGLVGSMEDGTTITDSQAKGSVTGIDQVGGVVGSSLRVGTLLRVSASGNVSGRWDIGGIIGRFEGDDGDTFQIHDSYSVSSVFGQDRVGGLAGWSSQAVVRSSYATGRVTATGDATDTDTGVIAQGGVVGENSTRSVPTSTFTDVVWNTQTTGQAVATSVGSISAEGLTTQQMRSSTNFPGWNFSTVWGYQCATSIYPQLRAINVLATATSCLEPAPDNGGGDSPPLAPEVINTAPSVLIVPEPTIATPIEQTAQKPQTPGTSGLVINGQEVPVSTQRGVRGRGITLQAGAMTFTLRSQTARGQSVPLAPDGSLILARTGDVPISGDGLEVNSSVIQMLYSDPTSLGSTQVDPAGSFTATPVIASTVPVGPHTLQISGRTKSGAPFVLSIGVRVETPVAALGADPVLTSRPSVVMPGALLALDARGVQAGCRVTFEVAGERASATASKSGLARAEFMLPSRLPRTVAVRASVTGPKCNTIKMSKNIRTR